MSKYDIYMQLGKTYETRKSWLLAYGFYMEAQKYAEDELKEENELIVIRILRKIRQLNKIENENINVVLLDLLESSFTEYAVACFMNIVELLGGFEWTNNDNAILYHCFQIYDQERKLGIGGIELDKKNMEEIKSWYYSLKFLIHRIDMKVMEFEETCSEVKVRNFSIVAMWYMISSMCFHKNEVMEYMEKVYEELGMTSYAMWFQKNADVFPKQKKQNIVEYETIHSNETVAFIIAVNDELIFQEAVYYIEHLHMPNGMKKEIIPVRGATSMANAYNEGMRRSKAKYKVYMHQDVLLVYKELLYEMLDIFQDEKIGMIGVAGTTQMPSNGIWWESEERNVYMKVYQDNIVKYGYSVNNEFNEKYKRVKYLDGLLLITQYDIPWREDLFDNWHFYDISQCCEMECFNYQVVVARQNEVWCLHEQKWNKDIAEEYYKAREKFMEKYKSFI